MRTIQSFPLHLHCLAGPDSGTLLPLEEGSFILGRGVQWSSSGVELTDLETSQLHACLTYSSVNYLVQVTDLHSLNGVFKGSFRRLLPGFPRSFTRFKPVVGTTVVHPGEVLKIGDNYWQLSTPDESFKLTEADFACAEASRRTFLNRRSWFFIFPLVSITMLLSRWLPLNLLKYLGMILVTTGVFMALRWWFVKQQVGKFSPAYIPHLPVVVGSKQVPAEVSFTLPDAVRVRWCKTFNVAWFTQGPGSACRLPAGLVEVEGTDLESHCLTLGLLTLLKLKQAGLTASLTVRKSGDVQVKSGEQTWLFSAGAGLEIVDLRLRLALAPVLRGAALNQVKRHYVGIALIQETLDLEALDRLVAVSEEKLLPDSPRVGGLRVPVGIDTEGNPLWIDLVTQGPHALITGTTGSGKSVALRTWLQQLCRYYTAQQLRLVLFDYKGGATLQGLQNYPHTEGLVTDLEAGLTQRILLGLAAELKSRERDLLRAGFADLAEWEEADADTAPPRILCVVDEFRVMQQTHAQDLETLLDLAGRGRSLGMHLVLATQSAGGVIPAQLRANVSLRIAFRTATLADSLDVLGSAQAFEVSEPGVSFISVAGQPELSRGRWAITSSTAQVEYGRKKAPTLWQPSLGEAFESGRLSIPVDDADCFLGWVDLPQQRDFMPLVWKTGVLVVAAEGTVRERLLQQCGASACISLDEADISLWWVLLNNARILGIPVLIADLYGFVQRVDAEFGLGSGRELWDEVIRGGQRVLVGVAPGELNLCKGVDKVLLRLGVSTGKSLGLSREILKGLELLPVLTANSEAFVEAIVLRWEGLETLAGAVTLTVGLQAGSAKRNSSAELVDIAEGDLLAVCRQKVSTTELLIYTDNISESTEIALLRAAGMVVRVESPKPAGMECADIKQNACCITGYTRLLAGQLQWLKLPKYLKLLLVADRGVWLKNGGMWLRYTG
ncbi:FtsK/SpoIIIE domain-containing protein [Gleimia coleocanis]|uniref:FtsK/SpoIIIE domain-containing protein n=1 Tax=Gleimia coleocanis TaxID=103618 RepID=UPI00058E0A21|nr:FtsK/SpoIIIE domain-containing protein [Gleimia coleocanis]